jgi:hypothetical protein
LGPIFDNAARSQNIKLSRYDLDARHRPALPGQGGYMRNAKRFVVLLFAFLMVSTLYVASTPAQTRKVVRKPVIVRHYVWRDPFWYSRNWWWNNDPYFYDPYLRLRRERYELEKDVAEERKDLREDREKYLRDGVIDAKEQEKLFKQQQKVDKAIAKLNNFNRDHDFGRDND